MSKRAISVFSAAFLLWAFASPGLATVDLDVYVENRNGVGLPDATVLGLVMDENGPDVDLSTFAYTNASGTATLTLQDDQPYHVFAVLHGYRPGVREQIFDPDHPFVWSSGTPDPVTVRVSSADVAAGSLTNVIADVVNASGTLVFGSLERFYVNDSNDPISVEVEYGMCATAAGACQMSFLNVATATAGEYYATVFDPAHAANMKEECSRRPVVGDTTSSTLVSTATVDFDGGYCMSRRTDEVDVGGDYSVPSLEGVLIDTNTPPTPLRYMDVAFDYWNAGWQSTQTVWAHTDENGRFQMWGLNPNATYYADIQGGCSHVDQGSIRCYDAEVSTAATFSGSVEPGIHDFVYNGTPLIHQIKLQELTYGTTTLLVLVKDAGGNLLPWSHVSIWPDWSRWQGDPGGSCGADLFQEPGRGWFSQSATDGTALFESIPPGNYRLEVWTQFDREPSNYNAGPDKDFSEGGHCGTDDWRLYVSSQGSNAVHVYDADGNALMPDVSSATVVVQISTDTSATLTGTMTFPRVVDLSQSPITVMLRGRCGDSGCERGGFGAVSGSGASQYAFNVQVASVNSQGQPAQYELRLDSDFWGRVQGHGGEHFIAFKGTDTVRLDIQMKPAGVLTGVLRKPDGSIWRPTRGQGQGQDNGAWVDVGGECGWGGNEVNDQGEFRIGGLLPCDYTVRVHGWGNFPYAIEFPAPRVAITENAATSAEVQLVDGIPVRITVDTTTLPSVSIGPAVDDRPPLGWVVRAFPQGMRFTRRNIADLMMGEGGFAEDRFDFLAPGSSWCGGQVGFCPRRLPAGKYDLLLMLSSDFRPGEPGYEESYQFITFFNERKGMVISEDAINSTTTVQGQGQELGGVEVDLTPSTDLSGQGFHTLRGSATATNIFREQDFLDLGGSFDNFLKYIPIVTVKDSSDSIIAIGMITPCPSCITQQQDQDLTQSIAEGNWSQFTGVFAGWENDFAYEIKGLKSTQTVSVLFTTPNYPPVKKTATLTEPPSTTTVHIDFDADAGTPATISGVVRTTDSVAIGGATVRIESQAYGYRTQATKSDGTFSFQGLPQGVYKAAVKAAGYVRSAQRVDLSEGETEALSFSLRAAGDTFIAGTVYKERFPFPRKAKKGTVYCYSETFAINNTTSEVPLYKVKVSTAGDFKVTNLWIDTSLTTTTYRCSAKLEGKFILSQSTDIVNGASVAGFDFYPPDLPPRIEVFCKAKPDTQTVDCTIDNPSDFDDGWAWIHAASDTWETAQANGRVLAVPEAWMLQSGESATDNEIIIRIPFSVLEDNVMYNLHGKAVTASTKKEITRDIVFSKHHQEGAGERDIGEAILGESEMDDTLGTQPNQVCMDPGGGNNTCVTIPVGALLPTSDGAVPSMGFEAVGLDASTVAAMLANISSAAFVSGVYRLDSGSVTFADRGLELCLGYDETGSELDDVAVHRYDQSSGKWKIVEGQQSLDPNKNTVCVRVANLGGASVASQEAYGASLRAMHDGTRYTTQAGYRPMAAGAGGSGTFGILKPSLTQGVVYAGDSFKVYNFPNPFDLNAKTLSIAHGGATTSLSTNGTVIKLEVPSSVDANKEAWVRVYTIAGELVKELHLGRISGGNYYYQTWDGRNKGGERVANGVYYGIVAVDGLKAKDATFKMAVIK